MPLEEANGHLILKVMYKTMKIVDKSMQLADERLQKVYKRGLPG